MDFPVGLHLQLFSLLEKNLTPALLLSAISLDYEEAPH